MKPQTVAVLATIFCALFVLDLATRSPSGRIASPFPASVFLDLSPSSIVSIRSERDGTSVELQRGTQLWTLASGSMTWPVDDRRLQSGLRVLASAEIEPSDMEPEGSTTKVRIQGEIGSVSIIIGERSLSGFRPALVNNTPARISDQFAKLLQPDALSTWATPAVFPSLAGSISSINIASASSSLSLARTGSRWGLTSPVRTPAEPDRVSSLIGALAALESDAVLSEVDNEVDSVGAMTISIESPDHSWMLESSGDGTATATMRLGSAVLSKPIAPRGLPDLIRQFDAESMISSIAVDIPASDIADITIARVSAAPRTLSRAGRSWTSHQTLADALLEILTSAPAGTVLLQPPPADAITISLRRFGDLPAGTLELWSDSEAISVHQNGVIRRYMLQNTPAAVVLASRLSDGD